MRVKLGAALTLIAGPALSQTTASQAPLTPGDIIVTATRRAERLQDVPISVSAFSQEKLDKQALRSIDDLSRFSPGVTFTRNGLSGNYNDASNSIAIRGIDSSAGAATTGIYVDDTPIQSRRIGFGTQNAYPALFDLDRVEVLRGPQGTLFGAGSEGGTVRFLAPSPSLSDLAIYGRAEGSVTEKGGASGEVGFGVGIPLIRDTLGLRLSASYRHDGGWVDRVNISTENPAPMLAQRNANFINTATLRAALKWQATPDIAVQPSLYWQRQYVNDTGAYWSAGPALSDPGNNVFVNGDRLRNTNRDPFWLAALKIDGDLGFATLTSNTSYYRRRNTADADYTQFDRNIYFGVGVAPANAASVAAFTDAQNNFYEEVRLSSKAADAAFSWTVGAFYGRLIENSTEFVTDPTLPAEYLAAYGAELCGTGALACPGGLIFSQPVFRVVDTQYAAFGEAKLKLAETLSITAGVRVSQVRFNSTNTTFGPFFGGAANQTASGRETPVTPRVSVNYQPNRDTLIYASAAKGFRVGGINPPLPADTCAVSFGELGITQVPTKYKSDSLWSYEAGAKVSTLGRRLTINGSAFLIDWRDIQQNVYLPSCGLQYTDNLGTVRSLGADLEIAARPTDALSLGLTVAYTDAYYTRPSGGVAAGTKPIVSANDRLRGSPWSIVASAEYRLGSDRRNSPYVRADYQLSTRLTRLVPGLNPANALGDATLSNLPSTSNLNLRAGYTHDAIDLSLFIQNVTNDLPILYNSRDVSYTDQYFARSVRPRTFGVTLTYRQ